MLQHRRRCASSIQNRCTVSRGNGLRAFCSIASGVVEARMRKKKTLSLRVSAEFKEKLVEEATKEKRSITSYIEVALGKLWERE